jgi:hypothetical protein
MSDPRDIDRLLATSALDAGCAAGFAMLHLYVELELGGGDPARQFPGLSAHLRSCSGCHEDYLGLIEAARRFGGGCPPPT